MAAKRKEATIGERVNALLEPKPARTAGKAGRAIGRAEGRISAGKTASKAAAKAGKGQVGLASKVLGRGGPSSSGGPSVGKLGAKLAPRAGKVGGKAGKASLKAARSVGRVEGRLAAGKTAGKAAAKAGKGQASVAGKLLKSGGSSSGGPSIGKLGAKLAPKAGKAGGRAGRAGGKAGLKVGRTGAKAAYKAGVARAKLANQGSGKSGGGRFLKYGLFTMAGLAVGALIGRSGGGSGNGGPSGSTGYHTPDPDSPAGQRGETWGSGTPLGSAGGGGSGGYQSTEDENRTGADRDYSDPSSGPLIGEEHRPGSDVGTGQQEEVEQRIRTRIGEDSRTKGMSRVNVEVNEGVAELRGVAPTTEAKDAAGEIAAGVEGVNEVRNLVEVGS